MNPLSDRIKELEEETSSTINVEDVLLSIKDFCDDCVLIRKPECTQCYLFEWQEHAFNITTGD